MPKLGLGVPCMCLNWWVHAVYIGPTDTVLNHATAHALPTHNQYMAAVHHVNCACNC